MFRNFLLSLSSPLLSPRRQRLELSQCDDWCVKTSHTLITIEKTNEIKDFLKRVLKDHLLFMSYSDYELTIIIDAFEGFKVDTGQIIITEGCDAGYFYIVKTGKLSTYIIDVKKKRMRMTTNDYLPGMSFGELPFIKKMSTQKETVKAAEGSELWRLNGTIFTGLISHTLSITELERWTFIYSLTINNIKIRDKFILSTFYQFYSTLTLKEYPDGEAMIIPGFEAECAHIVYNGRIAVSQSLTANNSSSDKEVEETLQRGDIIGQNYDPSTCSCSCTYT